MDIRKEYTKTFEFGKVADSGTIKRNLVELDVTLKIEGKKIVFSASGSVWNHIHTDIIRGGQCIDDVYSEFKGQLKNRKQYEAIMALWEKWHLNDMHAGCIHQEAEKWDELLIDPSKPKTQENMRSWKRYEEIIISKSEKCSECGTIKSAEHTHTGKYNDGLMCKPCAICGYKYGTSWQYRAIDQKDLREIMQLLAIDPAEQLRITTISKMK